MKKKIESLTAQGFSNLGTVHWCLPTPSLYEWSIRQREGLVSHLGPLVVRTGQYTGRSPRDKYIVADPSLRDRIFWGEMNHPFLPEKYRRLKSRVQAYLQCRDLYVQDMYLCADQRYRVPLRVITENSWHSLFVRNMFIREPDWSVLERFDPEYTIIFVPNFRAIPDLDGTLSEVFLILNYAQKEILIGGTAYGGTLKKAAFSLVNFLLPERGVLSLHASANFGDDRDDVALFIGLSGVGKTSLAVEPFRTLVADDQVGWSDEGIFNIEGGCYAKVCKISPEEEPEIYETTRKFGTVLENVSIDPYTRRMDLNDDSMTGNTRAAFPMAQLGRIAKDGVAGHPRVAFLLTADMFGVLPPLARLTPEQAVYYFLLGYTARLAGTEQGLVEPVADFSPAFAAPFLALPPVRYAEMFRERIERHGTEVWLVNTGWTGGGYGVGNRFPLPLTRRMIGAVMDGNLSKGPFEIDPVFGFEVPSEVPGVPVEVLRPRMQWSDQAAFDREALSLARRFRAAFEKVESDVHPSIRAAGPRDA